MSFTATAWAKNQKTGSASGKLVLMMLAEHADHSGVCFPSRAMIADESEQSIDTVDRRMVDLEELGLIIRERRLRESGATTTHRVRLCFSPEIISSELKAHRDPSDRPAASEGGEPQIAAPPAADAGGGRTVREGGAAMVRPPESSEPDSEPESPPLTPPPGGHQGGGGDQDDFQEDAIAFWRAYPVDTKVTLKADIDRALRRLSIKDRKLAVRMAKRYAEEIKDSGRRIAIEAVRWIEKRGFADMADRAQGEAEAAGLKHPPVFVRKNTPAWTAWENHWRRASRMPPAIEMRSSWSEEHKASGAYKPTLFPPPAEADAPGPGEAEGEQPSTKDPA